MLQTWWCFCPIVEKKKGVKKVVNKEKTADLSENNSSIPVKRGRCFLPLNHCFVFAFLVLIIICIKVSLVQAADAGVADVSAGGYHTAILKTDGTLWMCGNGYSGQLGTGDTLSKTTPVKIMTGVKAADAGGSHTAILKSDGSLWMCGSNSNGQLGTGNTTNKATPEKIMTGVKVVSAGGTFKSLFILTLVI